jgi:NCS1 family nucleobase:cation symporter-1
MVSLVTLCALLGVVVTSAAQVIYGVNTWNPLQVSALMGRAPMFFSALCWAFSVIATNISANTTAVGNDLMLAFPRYINIRRVSR